MKKKITREIPVYYIFPILFIITIVPLIVHLKVIKLDELSFSHWIGEKNNTDFFSYYKAMLTIIFSVVAIAVALWQRYKENLKFKNAIVYYMPIAIYAIAVLLSAAASKYPRIAQLGFIDRYEGEFTLLAYMIIVFVTINLTDSEKQMKVLLAGLFVSAFILGTIGLFQFLGADFFRSYLGKSLMLPAQYDKSKIDFKFGPRTIYTTLYNTNYVGSYMAMLLPLSVAAFLLARKNIYKIISGLLACLMFANLIGCRSRTGYVGGAVALLFLIVLLRKTVLKNIKWILPLFLSFILIFIGMNSLSGGELGGRAFGNLFKGSSPSNNASTGNQNKVATSVKATDLKDIVFSDKKVTIVNGEDKLSLVLVGNQISFRDTEEKELGIKKDAANNITFNDARYSAYTLAYYTQQNTFVVQLGSMKFGLYVTPQGFKMFGERNIMIDNIDRPEKIGFEGKEKFASTRGYIWSRSIPLLKKNVLIGGGPDTFVIQFPQHDFVGKLRTFDTVAEIIDKPHNWYLQMGINTGVLSMLAILFLLGAYLISSVKIYFKKEQLTDMIIIGTALSAAVLGYAVTGVANDSIVSVAPVFWILLGLGISCNYLNTGKQPVEDIGTGSGAKMKVQNTKKNNTVKSTRK